MITKGPSNWRHASTLGEALLIKAIPELGTLTDAGIERLRAHFDTYSDAEAWAIANNFRRIVWERGPPS